MRDVLRDDLGRTVPPDYPQNDMDVDAERRAYRDVDHRWDHQTLSRKHHKDMTNAAGTFDHRTRSIPVTDFAVATPRGGRRSAEMRGQREPAPARLALRRAGGSLRPPPLRISRRPLEPVDQPRRLHPQRRRRTASSCRRFPRSAGTRPLRDVLVLFFQRLGRVRRRRHRRGAGRTPGRLLNQL